jgi:natural product precursor
MKILKSGIEMTPAELNKLKGGYCTCACGIYVSSINASVVGEESGLCTCYCGVGSGQDRLAVDCCEYNP